MRRREVLGLLLSLLSGAALANSQEGKEGKKREEGEKKRKGEEKTPPGASEVKEDQVFYGQVEAVQGTTLWVAGRALRVKSPLLPYLVPGMVVQVKGPSVTVVSPGNWAYYQGPGEVLGLGRGPVRAWWKEGVLWRVWPGGGQETLVVARFEHGVWLGLPKGLPLGKPPIEGWWLVRLTGSKVKGLERLGD
ncbi:hypothetical protein [Thermus tengchongensis]|uniref:DNA-binding protein n=1 Tax=Thermus tengchongensis TaxID=1214928 RepID=A0ABY2K4Q4_9DEIN|nr:hypothetical protein [Thermus tengchongensis]TFU15345.1 hypothetical protein E0489_09950 [Thermus tengchongensis]